MDKLTILFRSDTRGVKTGDRVRAIWRRGKGDEIKVKGTELEQTESWRVLCKSTMLG